MGETIRSWGTVAAAAALVQLLDGLALGETMLAPGPLRPWLYALAAGLWAPATWRALRMRLDVGPEGVRSHGLWRTRFVAWDDVVLFEPAYPRRGVPLWSHPTALTFRGSRMPLTAVCGLIREGPGTTGRLCEHLDALCDEA